MLDSTQFPEGTTAPEPFPPLEPAPGEPGAPIGVTFPVDPSTPPVSELVVIPETPHPAGGFPAAPSDIPTQPDSFPVTPATEPTEPITEPADPIKVTFPEVAGPLAPTQEVTSS